MLRLFCLVAVEYNPSINTVGQKIAIVPKPWLWLCLGQYQVMASSATILSSSLLPARAPICDRQDGRLCLFQVGSVRANNRRARAPFRVQAAKPPAGVELPKVQPKFEAPFLGFTKTAEIWNSRASMIGLIGIFVVELILNKGILQVIGVDIGKGLDLPL